MKPRAYTEIRFYAHNGQDPYPHVVLSLDESNMTLCIEGEGFDIPDEMQENDACEFQTIATRREYAKKVVKLLYKGVRTSTEVKEAEVDRIADILKILINTALPDME